MLPKLDTPSPPPTVFVLDHDGSTRRSLERLLRATGHDVVAFASGLAFVDSHGPDGCGCVLADLQLPDLPGLELLRFLNQRESVLSPVLISAHASVAVTVHAMKLGAHDFLTRPCDET